jgi:DNA repair exonuclease SbcCD nuclease subunit
MRGPRPTRIVHTSDVHLGAYTGNEGDRWDERRRLIETAFRRVIDLANTSDADLLVIAGDFFDNDRVPPETVSFAIEALRRVEGKVVILPGNHDPMDEGSIYWRNDFEGSVPGLKLVREHAGEFIESEDLDVVLWGRAFLDSDWHFKPLDGIPQRVDGRWHIALAHGHYHRDGEDSYRSLPILASEVAAASGHWDYMAFGHWEPHADVSTGEVTAIYSGAPMPLSDANRRAGWATVVDFDDDGVRWRLERVDPRAASAK